MFGKTILNCLPASHNLHQINWKTTPCLITKTEYLPYFIVNLRIKCLPALWLSIAFSDTDLMFQFCLPHTFNLKKIDASLIQVLESKLPVIQHSHSIRSMKTRIQHLSLQLLLICSLDSEPLRRLTVVIQATRLQRKHKRFVCVSLCVLLYASILDIAYL